MFGFFFLPRARLKAFQEVEPVQLANCKLVKGIGKYVRGGSISFEFAVLCCYLLD